MPNSQYVCVMFPYPSGAGLHVGHHYNYSIMDSYCRWQRHRGIEVFQPFGYDAFGLPAENYARQIGGDPRQVTMTNIARFREQMAGMNTQYEERLVTCDSSYVKWTQAIFTLLRDRGLAYKAWSDVNWCTSCETVLANEQVKDSHCERCGSKVETRNMNQWFFKITDYRDRLIANLDTIDYPAGTKKMQREWLKNLRDWCVSRQRSWGCPIPIEGETDTLDTFVDSSFYFLRYLTDSQDELLPAADYRQVDLYVGGAEHACMHLLYARFIHMVLFDAGIVPVEEPFKRVIHQGMVTRDGAKMGKSKGNAVDPDEYDPDELRLYLMFMGPYQDGGDWNDASIKGVTKFLNRMRAWLVNPINFPSGIPLNKLEEDINREVDRFKFNRVVSTLMTFYNTHKGMTPSKIEADRIVTILRVFAPGFTIG